MVTRIARLIFASSFASSTTLPVSTQNQARTYKYGLSHHAQEMWISLFMLVCWLTNKNADRSAQRANGRQPVAYATEETLEMENPPLGRVWTYQCYGID